MAKGLRTVVEERFKFGERIVKGKGRHQKEKHVFFWALPEKGGWGLGAVHILCQPNWDISRPPLPPSSAIVIFWLTPPPPFVILRQHLLDPLYHTNTVFDKHFLT